MGHTGRHAPTAQTDALDGREAQTAVDIAAGMLAAQGFDDRWRVMLRVLATLGADAVNAAALDAPRGRALWFRSSLPEPVLRTYEAEGHAPHDTIVARAARVGGTSLWRPASDDAEGATAGAAAFREYVMGSGTVATLNVSTLSGVDGVIHTMTLCTQTADAVAPGNAARVERAIRLMLPWLGRPERAEGPDYLRLPGLALSRREAQAIRLLAGGLMNARIAEAMGLSEVTVAKHLRTAREKLGARTREEALTLALRTGVLADPARGDDDA